LKNIHRFSGGLRRSEDAAVDGVSVTWIAGGGDGEPRGYCRYWAWVLGTGYWVLGKYCRYLLGLACIYFVVLL
jgi:hypothetical protein